MSKAIRSEGIFLLFGSFAIVNSILVYLFLPETKGRSLPEIEDYFKGPSIFWMRRKKGTSPGRLRNGTVVN